MRQDSELGCFWKQQFWKTTRHRGLKVTFENLHCWGEKRFCFCRTIPTLPARSIVACNRLSDHLPARLRCHPVCRTMLENQGRLMTLAAREDLRKHVPILSVNEGYLWSTLNSPRVLEQQHNGQIQPLVRSVGSRKPFPSALMGAGPSPAAPMTSP